MLKFILAAALVAVPCPPPVVTAVLPVVGAQAAINATKPGDVITLEDGLDYGTIVISKRNWTVPVTINADKAFVHLHIKASSGLIVNGGIARNAQGAGAAGYGVWVQQSRNVTFNAPMLVDNLRGIVLDRVQDVSIDKADISGGRIDGINIAASQRVTVTNSICHKFQTGTAHPDCIQMWSMSSAPPTADVLLRGNKSLGDMQGFTGFYHVRNGVGDGGYDRITIDGNYVESAMYPNAVVVDQCRDCSITNNTAVTLLGARWKLVIRASGQRIAASGNSPVAVIK